MSLSRTSMEIDDGHIALAPRRTHVYVCQFGHETSLVFAAEAVPPPEWDCSVCPSMAFHEGREPAVALDASERRPKTHWEQLISRRSEAELEALLAEALSNLREFGKAF